MADFEGRNPGESLESFIDRVVNPDSSYVTQTRLVIHTVADLMRSKSVDHKVGSTVKGGSLGKGTAVKGRSDADLLFVYADIPSIDALRTTLPKLLRELQSALALSKHKVTSVKRTPFTIQFEIEVNGQLNEVDVLPIIQLDIGNWSKAKMNPIYQQMKTNEELREYYFKCLAPLQVEFVSKQDEKIKRSIRLLKYWIKTRKHVLKSYAAELLVIKAYEEMGSPQVGKMKSLELMKTVFTKLSDLKSLTVSWDKYYTPSTYYLPSPPYILDPAFPFHNLTRQKSGIDEKYVHLERDAKKFLANLK
ncbi:2'-5'-oligoadenylate synthase 1-like isoform X2 [Mytilus californianus]|nr:2'-5'-oligoadenylate synthase 1-like isoform X2 [Mytilus californianus]XP_052085284.1 2'-5'-oligoadenylate synthase 1-like isoform X2 [Mytilus californianus]XP_052085285.1 2'-5'-oligoadenylate synthase 1-like isoform X2 [Mytilus californianus]